MPGDFALMLHSHIPYCRKSGVWPAGEEWLFEALNETYIPLLRTLRALLLDGIRPRVMIGVVPVLMEQLADGYMRDRFCVYLEDKIRRAEHDVQRFRDDPGRRETARYWLERFQANFQAYTAEFYRDILGTLKWLQEEQAIEVLTSAATHGFLPLLEQDSAVFAQVRVGVATYRRFLGCAPRGFWLPECAYRPAEWSSGRERDGIDAWLAREGIAYFCVEHVGLTRAAFQDNRHGESAPTTYRGYRLASGTAVFGRNEATGKQVWSPEIGYPGDPHYLEFHRKDSESGLHYWRVTGHPDKQLYDPLAAAERVEAHAQHFVGLLRGLLDQAVIPEAAPLIVAPYDGELFGHWWHEGVAWLERVYRLLALQSDVTPRTLGEYIDRHGQTFSTINMSPSTWGLNSDYTVWLNPEHGWIWPYINACCREMEEVLARVQTVDERGDRILRQAARELLLMQGSDWPFLLFTTQAKEYANQRFHHHHQRFRKLIWAAGDLSDHGRIAEAELREIEDVDCPWDGLDYGCFRKAPHPAGPVPVAG